MTKTNTPSGAPANSERSEKFNLTGQLKNDAVYIVSAIGTALTIISTLKDTLTVASWARGLLDGFQSAASGFWAFVLPGLSVEPKPMDVLILNMSVFIAVLAIGSLGPRAEVPTTWREWNWRSELASGVGALLAVTLFSWTGYYSIQSHLNGEAATQFLTAIETVTTVEEMEAAALTYMSEISAFAPGIDRFGQVIGLTSGPLQERVHADFLLILALYLIILLAPFFSVVGLGAVFNTRWDSRKSSRWIWLFLGLVAATFLLGWMSEAWSEFCADRQDGMIKAICGLDD